VGDVERRGACSDGVVETRRYEVSEDRFDTQAAREEMARIEKSFGHLCDSGRAELMVLLARALDAIDATWPEPAADVVERASLAAWNEMVTRGFPGYVFAVALQKQGDGTREDWKAAIRAALVAAGRLPDVQPAASRPFRPTADMSQSVMASACFAAGYTEEQTIERLATHSAILERDMRRLLETQAVPLRAPAGPPVDPREERLTRYRCAAPAFIGSDHDMSPADIAGIVESYAHAMLAAERAPVAP